MPKNKVPVELLLTRYFVRYNRLDKIIPVAFAGSKACELNLYIDLYGIYKNIFSRQFLTDVSDYTAFTSTLINMCAHYRSYFKGLGVKTKIFLVSSYNIPEINCKFVAGYNKTFIDKLNNKEVKDMTETNLELLDILCPYLPDIHLIHTQFESTVMINHLIQKEMQSGNNAPNIIISTDIYPMQLCALYDNTVMMKPRKSNGDDITHITCPRGSELYYKSFWWIICMDRGDAQLRENIIDSLSPINYMLLMSLTKFPERDMRFSDGLTITHASKLIYDLIGSSDNKIDVQSLFNLSENLSMSLPIANIDSRYKVLDISYQNILFNESIEPKVLHYENLWDPDAVQLINSKYFQHNPIDLFHL